MAHPFVRKLHTSWNRLIAVEFIRFCIVGGVSTVLNYSSFFLLYIIGVQYLIAAATGYLLGVLLGFALNRRFTFRSTEGRIDLQITKYFIVYTISLFLGLGLLRLLAQAGVPVLLGNVFSIGLTTMTNYLGTRYLVFRKRSLLPRFDFYLYRYKYLFRYVVIGLGSILLELILVELLGRAGAMAGVDIPLWTRIGTGFLAGMLFSFVLNARWNFHVPKERNVRTFRVFLIISTFSFCLNLLLIRFVVARVTSLDYGVMRLITAGAIFLISYTLHRKITFVDVKEIGVAVYLAKGEDVEAIKRRLAVPPDFIHLDLVDPTFNPRARPVDLSVGERINAAWPGTMRMLHIMSRRPSAWVKRTRRYADYIVIHAEIDEDVGEVLALCRRSGCTPGLSVRYDTPIESIIRHLDKVAVIQVLGIEQPGESNQRLQLRALEKLELINLLRLKYGFKVCFDGGVKLTNVGRINAKYVVSSSAVLNAQDPKLAVYDLKTSSRYYGGAERDLTRHLQHEIRRIAEETPEILSGTVVGSSARKETLQGVSDVDIVLIVPEATRAVFELVVGKFRALENSIQTDFGYGLVVNTSFGPLKFDAERMVVLHLMVYDVAGHEDHCRKSPFTCLDWQLSALHYKAPMTRFAAVTALQPSDFFSARRSISEYLAELRRGVISYREYEFRGNRGTMIRKEKRMENRDRFEFAYHVMRFSMRNLLKLAEQANVSYDGSELLDRYFALFPDGRQRHDPFFRRLWQRKEAREFPSWRPEDLRSLESFLSDFERQFHARFETGARKLLFLRHAPTPADWENRFLGSDSDPSIERPSPAAVSPVRALLKRKGAERIYSSPLRRCTETAGALGFGSQLILDSDLREIDYGALDGERFDALKRYPALQAAWAKRQDPRFPGGESTRDVERRLTRFLGKAARERRNAIICTHNVVLRCLVGSMLRLPRPEWHRIRIPHLEPIEVAVTADGRRYLNLTAEQRVALLGDVRTALL